MCCVFKDAQVNNFLYSHSTERLLPYTAVVEPEGRVEGEEERKIRERDRERQRETERERKPQVSTCR